MGIQVPQVQHYMVQLLLQPEKQHGQAHSTSCRLRMQQVRLGSLHMHAHWVAILLLVAWPCPLQYLPAMDVQERKFWDIGSERGPVESISRGDAMALMH